MRPAISFILVLFSVLIADLVIAQAPIIDWDRSLGGSNYEEMHSMTLTSDEGILLAACSASVPSGTVTVPKIGGFDVWLVKLNKYGEILWEQRYGGKQEELAWISHELEDKGFIIGAQSRSGISGNKTEESRGGADLWFFKTDALGNMEWQKTLGGSGEDLLNGDIIPLKNGQFLLAATSSSDRGGDKSEDSRGGKDYWIIKTDRSGNVIWDRTYGGDKNELVQTMIQLQDGNFLVGGFSKSGISGDKTDVLRAGNLNDMWLLKLNQDGRIIWQLTLGGNWEEAVHDMVQAEDGTIYLTGFSGSDAGFDKTNPSYGNLDYWVVAIDNDGNKLWDRNFGGDKPDVPFDIHITNRGNLMVAGYANSGKSGVKSSESKGLNDYWIINLDRDGNLLWEQSYGGDGRDGLEEMEIMPDGSLILAGHTPSVQSGDKSEPSNGFNDVWLIKTSCDLLPRMPDSSKIICAEEYTALTAEFEKCLDCLFEWQHGAKDSISKVRRPAENTFYTLDAISMNGCIDSDTILLYYDRPSEVGLSFSQANCAIEMEVGNIIGGTPPYEYNVYGSIIPFQTSESPVTLEPGTPYEIVIADSLGCTLSEDILLGFDTDLEVELGLEQVVKLGETIELAAITNQPVDKVEWFNTVNLSCDSCLITDFTPLETVTVGVRVTDEFGCQATNEVEIFVERPYEVYAPNIFSPDGDGANEYFNVYVGEDVKFIHTFKIFDRHGRLVFENDNLALNQAEEGWSGIWRGKFLPKGVYIYFAEIEFIDGMTKVFKGDVTLFR